MAYFQTKRHAAYSAQATKIRQELYQLEPTTWLSERFKEPPENIKWSLHPEYKDHVWDGTKDPLFEAFKALSNLQNVGIEAATGVGKTWLLARIAFWFLDTFPQSLVITTAPTFQQLTEVLWKEIGRAYPKFKQLRPHSEMFTGKLRVDTRQAEIGQDEDKNVTHKMLSFVSSNRAGQEADIKFQGHHQEFQLFILEEAAGLNEAILRSIENTNVRRGNMAIAVGNPDSQVDSLHTFCEKKNTKHIIISAEDHPNIVCNRDFIPGAVTVRSINERREEYGEASPFYQSRVKGIAPAQDKDAMIMGAWLNRAIVGHADHVPAQDDGSNNAVGVDAAHSETGDKAACVWGRSNTIQSIEEFQCPSTTHLAYNLFMDDDEIRKQYGKEALYHTSKIHDYAIRDRNIGVDSVGVGAGTIDTLKDRRMKVVSLAGGQLEDALKKDSTGKPYYQFSALRSQMYWELAKDLEKGNININISDPKIIKGMRRELLLIRYTVRGGRISVEAKEEIKKRLGGKSPNVADGMAYWNWVRKNYYVTARHLPFN